MRCSLILAMTMIAFFLAACGDDSGNSGPEPVKPDTGPDLPAPPDVPSHVFELIEDVTPELGEDAVAPLPDRVAGGPRP